MDEARRRAIALLLATRFDGLPLPSRRDFAASGFVHDTLAPQVCPTCEGVDPHCPTCRGRGEVEVHRRRDPYATSRVTPYGLDETAREHAAAIDAAIRSAERELARFPGFRPASVADQVADADRHPYGWERLRRAMYERYDYAALDRCLERLRELGVRPTSARGMRLLDAWLPDPVRAPTDLGKPVLNTAAKGPNVDRRAREQRDEEVRRLFAEGVPLTEIRERVGLSARQLRRIFSPANRQDAA